MRTTFRILTAAASLLAMGVAAQAASGAAPGKSDQTPTVQTLPVDPSVAKPAAPAIAPGEPRPDRPRGPADFMAKADTNGDGKLSKEEFVAASSERAASMFSRMDRNGNGFVDVDEFPQPKPHRPAEPMRH